MKDPVKERFYYIHLQDFSRFSSFYFSLVMFVKIFPVSNFLIGLDGKYLLVILETISLIWHLFI